MLESSDLVAFVAATDLDRARFFYEQTLGLQVLERSDFALVLDANGTMLRVTAVGQVANAGWRAHEPISQARRCRRSPTADHLPGGERPGHVRTGAALGRPNGLAYRRAQPVRRAGRTRGHVCTRHVAMSVQPIAIHGAILAGARPEAVAGALGDTVEVTFCRWHHWARVQRDFIVGGKPGITAEEYDAVAGRFAR